MSADTRPTVPTVALEVLLWLGSLVLLGLFLNTVAGRLPYPYDLEWMEGGMLLHGLRIMEGEALFVRPTADFIPFLYPPLYPWLLGLFGEVFGLGYPLGRAISVIGTLAGAAALIAAVRGEGARWGVAVVSAAIFLSGWDETGCFFDLVRIDGLLIGLIGWSLVALRHGWVRTGGLLLVAAYATKHNAAIFGLPALIWLWRTGGFRVALRFVGWCVVPALLFTGAMLFEGDGLFLVYLLELPTSHPFVATRFFPVSFKEMIYTLPQATFLAGAAAVLFARRWSAGGAFWVAQGVLGILLAAVMRGHHGGYLNVLIPGVWLLALWGGLAAAAFEKRWPKAGVRVLVTAILLGQLVEGYWEPDAYQPTEADRAAGDAVIARLATVEGEVLAPHSPWYPVLAGKRPGFHLIALWDVDHEGGPLYADVANVDAAIASRRYAMIVTGKRKLGHGLLEHYERSETMKFEGRALTTKRGWKVRPSYWWTPKADPEN